MVARGNGLSRANNYGRIFVIIMRLMLIAPDHPALDFATSPVQKTYALYLSLRHLVLPFTVGLREWVITHPIITATIVGIAVWFSLLSLQHLRQRLVWLSLAWIALTLLPVMNVFKPWYLYILSIGFCFLLAWALTRPQGYRIATTAAIALVAFSYLYQSASQGMRWQEGRRNRRRCRGRLCEARYARGIARVPLCSW
jgi:hypothetical protein